MSKRLAELIYQFGQLVSAVQRPARRINTLAQASYRLQQHIDIKTARGQLTVLCPTARSANDPLAFYSQEPETLAWIDEFLKEGVLWDIGANIGLYTLYAALNPKVRAVAIEPSAQTFATLSRNIELNRMNARVQAFCLALDERSRIANLHMAHSEAGHSMHAFGTRQTVEGEITSGFEQATLGLSIDDLMRVDGIWAPDFIKLDVDSIEAAILRGGAQTLKRVRSVIVEAYGERAGAAGPIPVLTSFGFEEDPKFATMGRFNRVFVNRNLNGG